MAGHVLPQGDLRELPLVKRRGTHDNMTERQVALLGSASSGAYRRMEIISISTTHHKQLSRQ